MNAAAFPARANDAVLVTGGAGFIGTNLAARLLSDGRRVIVYDNLSRDGVQQNLRWLQARFGDRLTVEIGDTRDAGKLAALVAKASEVFHFAAQVAVTSSLVDPLTDFEVNLRGTLNLLEALRALREPPSLVFTSTNKVYGALGDVAIESDARRHQPCDLLLRASGVAEDMPLDFHSPYGCSKGAADQYILDYARSYGIPAVVLRMSCIYGPHQFGNEDQGWVAHFLIRALQGNTLTLYGDGRQVRDILYVDDLVEAMLLCHRRIDALRGRAFNMGGGPDKTISLVELLDLVEQISGSAPALAHAEWRVGDQRWYVSDTRAFEVATGWCARIGVHEGISRLHDWLAAHRVAAPRLPGVHAA